MDKVLDNHIRSEALRLSQLHRKQFTYQAGKSTVTALDNLVTKIENIFTDKEIALCTILDIEEDFDNTSYESIEREAVGGRTTHYQMNLHHAETKNHYS